jgi:hypothetical protein
MAEISERERQTSASSTQPIVVEPTDRSKDEEGLHHQAVDASKIESQTKPIPDGDLFDNEADADIQYKTCEW